MLLSIRIRALLVAAVALAYPAAAQAQIYVWRDAAGNLVLSDRATDPSARTYAISEVPAATSYRTTKPLTGRAAKYLSLIEEHAERNGVSADLVRAVIQAESAFNPRAVSPKGAMGLMQLMPATAEELGVSDPFDPEENIRGGVRYLKQLLDSYDGKIELALAAYNAGPGAVKKYGDQVPPYRETRNYVAKVRKNANALGEIAGSTRAVRTSVYRSIEIVNGREVVRYTDSPVAGSERVTAADRR